MLTGRPFSVQPTRRDLETPIPRDTVQLPRAWYLTDELLHGEVSGLDSVYCPVLTMDDRSLQQQDSVPSESVLEAPAVLPIVGGSEDPQDSDPQTVTILGLVITPANMMDHVSEAMVDDTNSVDLGPCWIVDKLLSQWMPPLQWNLHGLPFLDVTRKAMQDVSWGYPTTPAR